MAALNSQNSIEELKAETAAAERRKDKEFTTYATNKIIAQGLLDFALLSTNVSQLKYILHVGERHPHYLLLVIVISVSFCLQVLVGILLLLLGNRSTILLKRNGLNQIITIFIFIITVLNVVIAGFNMEVTEPSPETCKRFYSPTGVSVIKLNQTSYS